MLIESTGVAAHRSTPVLIFLKTLSAMNITMKNHLFLLFVILLTAACGTVTPPDQQNKPEKDPEGTIYYTETNEIFANPERGLLAQIYYTSADLKSHADGSVINDNRQGISKLTVYLHSYYLTDYMQSDIPQEFLDRLETNMNALRQGGGKAVVRFSYKSSFEQKDRPWDASPEWISKHIDQIAPYLQKHSDVIICVQCGFIGSWGEWYYSSNFKMNPQKDEDFEPRWKVLEHLLQIVPEDRQVALRTPSFKIRYLKMRGMEATPLTKEEAFKNTNKARIAAHNDCFISSSNDVGTYHSDVEREFWQEDTKYTFMGGETCEKCSYSKGSNAIEQMEKYHWSYINRDYRQEVTNMWRSDGTMDEMMRRLGYRLVLDKAYLTQKPKADSLFEARLQLHNVGFAAPMNKRDVELVFINATNAEEKYVYPQTEDPRFWMAGDTMKFTLNCTLDKKMSGEYYVYLNLPDPYESLHNDPRYSIRLANDAIWEEETGYNRLTKIKVE